MPGPQYDAAALIFYLIVGADIIRPVKIEMILTI